MNERATGRTSTTTTTTTANKSATQKVAGKIDIKINSSMRSRAWRAFRFNFNPDSVFSLELYFTSER